MTERDLVHALADGWGLPAGTLRYAPVGGGSYHWVVTSGLGEQWFVTVDDLDDKGSLGRPWTGGLFTEPARELLAGAAAPVRRGLDALDRWASATAAPENLVITHGEPHPGNIIRVAADGSGGAGPATGAIMLIDWDTVGLAPPERDLWMVATDTGDDLRRYTELTDRPVAIAAIERYRPPWALHDLSRVH